MAWPRLASRLGALKLALAGPLLRRVEADSVTVWFALKEARTVTLRVKRRAPGGSLEEFGFKGTRTTVALGQHLHVVAVTAKPGAGGPLLDGEPYFYDVRFAAASSGEAAAGAAEDLYAATGCARADLAYADHPLPSFVLPAPDVADLRIVHGSCRKPHGGGDDALAYLHDLLEDSVAPMAAANHLDRPQALFLTGDQIYADDVADAALAIASDAGDTLLAGRDKHPDTRPTALTDAVWTTLTPGRRQDKIHERSDPTGAGLSTHEGRSHLMTRGEFYATYLLAWSPALWPSPLPAPAELFPEEEAEHRDALAEYEAQRAAWDPAAQAGLPPPSPPRATGDVRTVEKQAEALATHLAALPRVRRALANTPTYMMFDDHEITDDWNITGEWVKRIAGQRPGTWIIRNGLLAYALFQAWGNTPEQFAASGLLAQVDGWDGVDDLTIDNFVGMPTGTVADTGTPAKHNTALEWHYSVRWTAAEALVLDPRTQRHFTKPDIPCELLSPAALDAQVPQPSAPPPPVTFVVAPAPVLGFKFVEEGVQGSWIAHRLMGGIEGLDQESWGAGPAALTGLLARLAPREKVVLLSGDVHYGFAAELAYWGKRGSVATRAAIAGFTSSSLHNHETKTELIHWLGYPQPDFEDWYDLQLSPEAFGVWNELSALKRLAVWWPFAAAPAIFRVENFASGTLPAAPDAQWIVQYLTQDAREVVTPELQPLAAGQGTPAGEIEAVRAKRALYYQVDEGKEVVGRTNLGEITFAGSFAVQTLHWRDEDDDMATSTFLADLTRPAAGAEPYR